MPRSNARRNRGCCHRARTRSVNLLNVSLISRSTRNDRQSETKHDQHRQQAIRTPRYEVELLHPEHRQLTTVRSDLQCGRISNQTHLTQHDDIPPTGGAGTVLTVVLINTVTVRTITVTEKAPDDEPVATPIPDTGRVSSLIGPHGATKSQLDHSNEGTGIPSTEHSVTSFVTASRGHNDLNRGPSSSRRRRNTSAGCHTRIFPNLTLILSVNRCNRKVPNRTRGHRRDGR